MFLVTEEDGNQFCQKEKISQLKDSFRNTDLNQTKKELENEKHVTQDTQKDWRKRKKRAVEDTEGERTQDTQTDQKRRTNNTVKLLKKKTLKILKKTFYYT
ncbi:Hypothetical predicted protein [Mytilus galloprovincialis]|uniref:Uncharacterized protein n=1 Tax=Mytilus galloprovincialis TaxID=29158 RepID=A0A8B6GKV4_MYTGA|nr:Hypothetical predicted protein [Mytilus galloprovincialis]